MKIDNISKFLHFSIVALLFLIPTIVFTVTPSLFFPYITGKNFEFRFLVEIAFVLWLILLFLDKNYVPKFSPSIIAVSIFIFIIFLADIFGVNPYKSFWSNFERMEGFVTIFHLFAYLLMWISIFKKESLQIWFFRFSLAISFIVANYGLSQSVFSKVSRVDVFLGNPIYFAVYILFHIFIAGILFTRKEATKNEKIILGALIAVEIPALYLTASRGAIIGFILGLFVVGLGVMFTSKRQSQRNIARIIIYGILALVALFVLLINTNFVKNSHVLNRFATISFTNGTVAARTYVWKTSISGVKEKPLLGWGQEGFNYVFNKYYDPRMYTQEQWFDRAHNVVFDWLIAGGILGFLAYLLVLFALLYSIYKTNKFTLIQKWIFVGLMVAYGFTNLTVFDNITSYILIFSILAWVNLDKEIIKVPKFVKISLMIVILLVLSYMGFVTKQAYDFNKIFLRTLSEFDMAKYQFKKTGNAQLSNKILEDAYHKFDKLSQKRTLGSQEMAEHMAYKVRSIIPLKWVNDTTKTKLTNLAKQNLKKQEKFAPKDPRFPVFLSSLYSSLGEYKNAKAELEKARKLSPNKQHIILLQAVNALNNKEEDKAIDFFKEAYELEKTNKQAGIIYAKALLDIGKKDEATKVLEELQKELNKR